MAEIFCITANSSMAGQYVSDLPVVNDAPVARQVGFYLAPLLTATSTTYSSPLETYLGAVEIETDAGGNQLASGDTVAGGGTHAVVTQSGTTVVTKAESLKESVSGNTLVARIIQAVALEGGDLTLSNLVAEIAACLSSGFNGGAVVFTSTAVGVGISLAELTQGSANISAIGIMRILSGASPDDAGSFVETGIVGNQRLVGGKRRIYLRDRTTASLGEGFLRTHSDSGALLVYGEDGTTL